MSSQPAKLVVRLLGNFQVVYDGRPVLAFDRVRLQALLSYLLLHRGKPVSRQQVAFLFWPDTTDKQAFTNLRNLLHSLRQALPDSGSYLGLTRKTVKWLDDAPCSLDVARFENALNAAERARIDGNLAQEGRALSQAIEAYGGLLLPELYDDWVLEQRGRLNGQSTSAMLRLAGVQEQQRDYISALETAQRLLEHDPLREEAYRLQMRLHALNGNRAAALRTYHTCVTALKEELGAGPSEETQGAYQRLLHMAPGSIASKPEDALVGRAPLVDRQAEWQSLLTVWQQARRGRPRIALISGEAGIGKTRLAEELLERVRRQGITAASARAYEAEGDMAYAPLAELLRSPALHPGLNQLDRVWLREVARLVPEVLDDKSRLEQPAPLTERWQLQRFFEALARAVLTGTEPVLLHLDDLQWCDSETLAWLAFLIRFRPTAKLLVVGTVRSEEIGSQHSLRPWLVALRQTGVLKEIELKPLDATATATLAHHISGYTLDGAEAERFYADTEGNPLFVVEMARARQEQDSLKRPETFSLDSMPSRMVAVLEARLAHLSASGRELAGVAAVIGREFAYPILAAASGADENEMLIGLEELWQRRIFRETGTDAYDFSHDKLREVAYQSLSSVRRRILHRRIAVALSEIHADRLDELSGELGVHYERAGLHDQARTHLQKAGDYAAARYASNEALAYYTRALHLAPESDFLARFELHNKREQVYALQTDQEKRRTELALMAQAADDLADDRLRAIVALRTAQLEYELGQPARSAECAQEAVSLAARAGDPETESASLLEWSRTQIDVGTLDSAQKGYQRALTLARSNNLLEIEARSLHGLSLVAVDQGDWNACRRHDGQALEIYRKLGDKRGEATILRHMGVVDELDWYPLEGRQKQLRALDLVREIGYIWLEPWTVSGLAWCSLMLGQCEKALSENAEALRLAQDVEDRSVEAMLLNDRVDMLHQLGRFTTGLETAQQALDIAVAIGNRLREANSLADVGLMLGDLGRYDESADSYRRSLEVYNEQGNDVALLRTRAGIARASLAMEDLDRAVDLVGKILPSIDDAAKIISISDGGAAIYLTCYHVLQKANDQRAGDILAAGYAFVQDRATRISDPVLRQSFLENLIEVNALVNEFERNHVGTFRQTSTEPRGGHPVTV